MPGMNSEGPDQTALMRSLIWAFAVQYILHKKPMKLRASNEGSGKTAQVASDLGLHRQNMI